MGVKVAHKAKCVALITHAIHNNLHLGVALMNSAKDTTRQRTPHYEAASECYD